MSSEVRYAPPSGPPPNHQYHEYTFPPGPPPFLLHPHPFLTAAFPLLSAAQIHSLSAHGFTTFPIAQRPALHDAASALFNVSRAFFAQPQATKAQFQVRSANAQGSEEGWSRVVSEKELLTLRRGGRTCPPSIENEGKVLWQECGALMQEITRGVEQSLGMQPGALDGVVSAECTMPEGGADRLESLLRMFRYERRSESSDNLAIGKGRLVAEPHRDLGLLSLVIGASPGLEVWNTTAESWIPIEEPPYAGPGLTATLLVGETLTRLTNARYAPGRHRVFVPSCDSSSSSADDKSHYRYSLVFALRPHANATISTAALTTPVTGTFQHPLEGVRARELFAAIARSHWNVNTGFQEREAQRLRLQGGATKTPPTTNGPHENNSQEEVRREENQQQESEQPASDERLVSRNSHKKKRWSLPIFVSSRGPSEGKPSRRGIWSVFQRVSRR